MTEAKRPLKVFLCHASADKPKVRELYRTLKRRGIQPWLDAEDLIPGQNWEVEIPKALLSSDAIIICLSLNSVDKEGYVQKEIKFALDKALEMPDGRIFLIPARLEDCDLPFSLSKYQAVNLFEKDGYTKLMRALKLRASQLHLATVKLPGVGEITGEIEKIVEERKDVAPSEPKTGGVDVGGDVSGNLIVTGSNNVINVEKQESSFIKSEEKRVGDAPKLGDQKNSLTKPSRKPNTAIVIALIGLAGTVCAALISSPLLANLFERTSEPTVTITSVLSTKTPNFVSQTETAIIPMLSETPTFSLPTETAIIPVLSETSTFPLSTETKFSNPTTQTVGAAFTMIADSTRTVTPTSTNYSNTSSAYGWSLLLIIIIAYYLYRQLVRAIASKFSRN